MSMFDVIVIGGSYAGLSAALQLGRARRRVLVVDAGQRRNRFARHSHGFLGQDGQTPEAIVAKGRSDVLAYPTVSWREARVTGARAGAEGFVVQVGDEELVSRRLILATGVVDELPPVPGLAERWGETVFHCPYCHGYELDRGRIGVLGTSPLSVHSALLASEWGAPGETQLFLNGAFEPDATQLAQLAARGIRVEREPVRRAQGDAPLCEVELEGGRREQLRGLLVMPSTRVDPVLSRQLGCEVEPGPTGPYYKTDVTKETSVPGVFACGDAASMSWAVAMAVADGAWAGIGAHRSLVFPR